MAHPCASEWEHSYHSGVIVSTLEVAQDFYDIVFFLRNHVLKTHCFSTELISHICSMEAKLIVKHEA